MHKLKQLPDILEVTLRDGAYLIDFQFTAEDTIQVATALESVGFQWIEIGHGLGLNASASGKGMAAASDEEYLEAANEFIKTARWGMFFIPGIGRHEDLKLAAKYGMDFVRIGADITDISDVHSYIDKAKSLGFVVSYNAMKSYAVTPSEFGQKAAQLHDWGADLVYLVDSAGGMYPDDVKNYLNAAKRESNVLLGFHGHDNLSLSMANTLAAVENGAVLVDSSLQGMGRSAGNAISEVLVAILKQKGMLPWIDLKSVMDIGQRLIQPLMGHRGMDPMAVTSGYARFHSSFSAKVQKFADKYKIDVRDLIVKLCQEDQVGAPDDLLEKLGRELAGEKRQKIVTISVGKIIYQTNDLRNSLKSLLRELSAHARKSWKHSVLNIVISDEMLGEASVSGNLHSTSSHMIGAVTLFSKEQLIDILEMIDGKVDIVFLDMGRGAFHNGIQAKIAKERLKKSLLLTYLDSRIWVSSVEDQVVRLLDEVLNDLNIVIIGENEKTDLITRRFSERGATVFVLNEIQEDDTVKLGYKILSDMRSPGTDINQQDNLSGNAENILSKAEMVILWTSSDDILGENEVSKISPGTWLLDARIDSMSSDVLEYARERNVKLARVNIWPALAGALAAAHESYNICIRSMGRSIFGGIPIVAGGIIGRKGDIVVDDIKSPTRVIGIANGRGGINYRYNTEEAEAVKVVMKEIKAQILNP